jgi:hypothetical protein
MFPLKPPPTLRQQSKPLPISFNGLAGLQRLNPQKYVKPQAVLYSSHNSYLRKDDSPESDSDSPHRTSSANSTKLYVNSNSFSQITTTPASSTMYKISPLQHPLTTPYRKLSRGSNVSLRHPPTSNSSRHLSTYQNRRISCLRQPFSICFPATLHQPT